MFLFSFLLVRSLQKMFSKLLNNRFVHRSEADDCNFFLCSKLIKTFMHWVHNAEVNVKVHSIVLERNKPCSQLPLKFANENVGKPIFVHRAKMVQDLLHQPVFGKQSPIIFLDATAKIKLLLFSKNGVYSFWQTHGQKYFFTDHLS